MTEQQKNKRTRRRFLADMLFLGGGVTAAAMLAKTQLAPTPPEPVAVGAMEVPVELRTSPTPNPAQSPECPPAMKGEPMPVEVEGEFALPEAECPPDIKGDVQVAPPPPKLGGKPIAPQPNGDGQ